MHIVADENTPLVKEFFAEFGDVQTLPASAITSHVLANADILLVRSTVSVSRDLLTHTPIQFVGSATIGVNHIDQQFLVEQGIGFANAPGCNAQSVAEYVLSALAYLSQKQSFSLSDKTVGIIGSGQIGSRLVTLLQALEISCCVYDPLLKDQRGLSSLQQVLAADIISLHAPLTKQGPHATYHWFDQAVFQQLKKDVILINTGRGEVINTLDLLNYLKTNQQATAVLDVWENEPAIDTELLQHVTVATPHIAGYSAKGKLKGTEQVYRACADYFKLPANKTWQQFVDLSTRHTTLDNTGWSEDATLMHAILQAYDVSDDDQCMRTSMQQSESVAEVFSRLRKTYPVRCEFDQVQISLSHSTPALTSKLQALGVSIA